MMQSAMPMGIVSRSHYPALPQFVHDLVIERDHLGVGLVLQAGHPLLRG